MSNHVHLLVEVLDAAATRAKLDHEEILRRLGLVVSADRVKEVRQMLKRMKEQSPKMGYPEYRDKLMARMFNVEVR